MSKILKAHNKLNNPSKVDLQPNPLSTKHAQIRTFDDYKLDTTDEADKENIDSNILSNQSKQVSKEPLKQVKLAKKNVSRNEIKHLDLGQIKFHKTFVNQKENTLVNQICMDDGNELQVELPNLGIRQTEDPQHRFNLKLIKDLGLRCSDTAREKGRNLQDSQGVTTDMAGSHSSAEDGVNPYAYSEGVKERQGSDREKLDGSETKTLKLRRDSSQKVILKNTSLGDGLLENSVYNPFKHKVDNEESQDVESVQNTNGRSGSVTKSNSVKMDRLLKASASSNTQSRGMRCVSPDIVTNKNSEYNPQFASPSQIHASPNTKKIIMQQAENIKALQNQILELQKLV